jgi:hypothetical protein
MSHLGYLGKLSITGLTLALSLLLGSAVVASNSNLGFAAYRVTVTLPGGAEYSILVNETVHGTDRVGFSDLILQLTGGEQNLTYSKLVNSSQNYFPYLTDVVSQSFDFSNGSAYAIHANFSAAGTTAVTFGGSKYTLSVFDIAVAGTYRNRTVGADGTIEVFPSSLVYSTSIGNETARIDAVLQATDLPLNRPQAGIGMTADYVGAGLAIGGAAAVGAALVVRHREEKLEAEGEKKPLHWVD